MGIEILSPPPPQFVNAVQINSESVRGEKRLLKRIRGKIGELDEKIREKYAKMKELEEGYVDALCENLRLLGLDATKVVSPEITVQRFFGGAERVLGSIRLANRNIDLVELTSFEYYEYEPSRVSVTELRCNYVIHARVAGLESKLEARLKPITVRKSFLKREIVDVRWEGKELAYVLNSDADLRDMLNRVKNTVFVRLEIKPYTKHQCIRIRQKGPRFPEIAFPTPEAFEAFDRIAQHIRSIAKVRS